MASELCFSFCEMEHKVIVKLEWLDVVSIGESESKVVKKVELLENRAGEVEKDVDSLDSFQLFRKGRV